MTPRVTLRKALEDPELLGGVLGGPTWHAWRSLLLAAMGEPLKPDELAAFQKFTRRKTPPSQRVDEFWCAVRDAVRKRMGKAASKETWP
jgi:hypothetical protein